MSIPDAATLPRRRAPSQRSLATRARVLDAAEKLFAERGYDGATIRDIAAEAGEPVGTVHHHGGGKAALFHHVVARRAETLSRIRLETLDRLRGEAGLNLESLLGAFLRPLLDLSREDPRWRHYARLVAYVSADDRWRAISAECFDPTAEIFLTDIVALLPGIGRQAAAEGFVFCVASMLALLTSQGRLHALGGGAADAEQQIAHLIRFCAAGLSAHR